MSIFFFFFLPLGASRTDQRSLKVCSHEIAAVHLSGQQAHHQSDCTGSDLPLHLLPRFSPQPLCSLPLPPPAPSTLLPHSAFTLQAARWQTVGRLKPDIRRTQHRALSARELSVKRHRPGTRRCVWTRGWGFQSHRLLFTVLQGLRESETSSFQATSTLLWPLHATSGLEIMRFDVV